MAPSNNTSRVSRQLDDIAKRVTNHPIAAAVVAIAGVVGAVALLVGSVAKPIQWIKDTIDDSDEWPQSEYDRVSNLQVGVNRGLFEKWLGEAPTRTNYFGEGETEDSYIRPGYWVQVWSEEGVVVQWSLMACVSDFTPVFAQPINATDEQVQPLRLWEGSFAEIGLEGVTSLMNVPGLNAPTYKSFGGPSEAESHRVTAWGTDTSCWSGEIPGNIAAASWECDDATRASTCSSLSTGATLFSQQELEEFRRSAPVNAWAQCRDECQLFPGSIVEDLAFEEQR